MKRLLTLLLLALPILSWAADGKRNLLKSLCTEQELSTMLLPAEKWVPFPAYSDREGWNRLPEQVRVKYAKQAERYLDFPWHDVKATEYLAFSRTGNRQAMENPQSARVAALRSLAMGELAEGKGRFMDDLVNGVYSFCEMSSWCLSACFYMHQRGKDGWNGMLGPTNLPDIEDPIIDLWVAEAGNDLSWIWYFFKDEFDKMSPVISKRLHSEITKRVLEPYYTRNDYWWITGWGRDEANNWNPWCNYNVSTAILLCEKDPAKRAKGIYKAMTSVDLFFNIYPEDGSCEEGPNYWSMAGAKAYDFVNLIDMSTGGKVNIFSNELFKNIGRYIYRVYISEGTYFVNFADAPAKIGPRAGLIYRYGERIGDKELEGFGVFLLKRADFDSQAPIGTFGPVLDDLFMDRDWKNKQAIEPMVGQYYFPGNQVAVMRQHPGTNDGFYLAAKGGSNGETHNHNDVGSGIIYYNGKPVFVDAGVGTYTKETFERGRYKIWTMQSNYHNLPVINGAAQLPGSKYKAEGSEYAESKKVVGFSTDIAKAYDPAARVEKWIRSYTLDRSKGITISDEYLLGEVTGKSQLRYVTPLEFTIEKGTVALKGDGFTVYVKYDPKQLVAGKEVKTIDDPKITRVWGDKINVLTFDLPASPKGKATLKLTGSNDK